MIEAEPVLAALRELWAQQAIAAERRGAPLLRFGALTLVVVTDGVAAADEVVAMTADLAGASPCRMLVVSADPSSEDTAVVNARTALTSLPAAGGHLVCEQVVLHMRGAAVSELADAVRRLGAGDLPLVLWWRAPLAAVPSILDEVAALADVVIIDSARGAAPRQGHVLEAVAGLLRRAGGARRFHLRDLAFSRLTPWREWVASLLDLPACRPIVEDGATLTVSGGADTAETRLFVGWLTSRLSRLTVRVVASSAAALAGVELEVAGRVRAWIRRREVGLVSMLELGAEARAATAPACVAAPLVVAPEASLVQNELAADVADEVYEAALRRALGLT